MQDSLFSQPREVQRRVEGVSAVVNYIRKVLENNRALSAIRVRGELSDVRDKGNRVYFDLKEGKDVIKCVVWANNAAKLPPLKDGTEVICDGVFSVYAPYSQYQLVVQSVELSGIGALYAQFEALKEKLRREGLFEASRKRALPEFPTRVAVVSAPDGRGVDDFFATMAREAPFVTVISVPTRVEGDGAEIDVAEAIDRASKMDVHAIVVTRGGGSYESLFTFNREPVIRAIVRARRPVITAIGHNADVHLSDFVADRSCETPSNAAHYFGDIGKHFSRRVDAGGVSLKHAIQRVLRERAQALDDLTTRLDRAKADYPRRVERRINEMQRRLTALSPQRRLAERAQRLTSLRSRLQSVSSHALNAPGVRVATVRRRLEASRVNALVPARRRFEVLQAHLRGADPQLPLTRGYAIVTYGGEAVRDASAVPVGATIRAQVQRGALDARVERTERDG